MGFNRRNHPAVQNGFRPRSLLKHEAEALFRAWYPCPPDMRAGNKFAIGIAGVLEPDPPRPRENTWNAAFMHHYWHELTAEQHQQPEWAPSNTDRYDAEFRRIHHERMTFWDGEGPPPRERNIEGQYAWHARGRHGAHRRRR